MSSHTPAPTEKAPIVGIIMPCFNMGEYIEEAIESLRNQTFKDFIVVIADDASTDQKTHTVLRNLELPKNMSIVFEDKNLGPAGIRNKYISSFNTKYVFPFDSDDMIDADFLQKSVDYLEKNPHDAAVAPWIEKFGSETGVIKLYEEETTLPSMLIKNNFLGACVLRKKAFDEIGGYDTSRSVQGAEDYDFWLSILEGGWSLGVIPEPLYKYRRLRNSLSSVSAKPQRAIELRDYLINKHLESYRKYIKEVIIQFEIKANEAHEGYLETNDRLNNLSSEYETLHTYVEEDLLPKLHQYEIKMQKINRLNPKHYARLIRKKLQNK